MIADRLEYEKDAWKRGYRFIAGVDEAGRGPLAGPVVSAAVILPSAFSMENVIDSKKLTPKKRDLLYPAIYQDALSIGIGIIDPMEIDRINILQASLLSMSLAVSNLTPEPDFVLIDGTFPISIDIPQKSIAHGDDLSVTIAAASIVAKVTRDRMMERYDTEYPQYGFSGHKGYPTRAHKSAIVKYGFCPIHRQSFKGVREYVKRPPATGAKK